MPSRTLLACCLAALLSLPTAAPAAESALEAAVWQARNDAAVALLRQARQEDSTAAAEARLREALALLDGLLATPAPEPALARRARFDRVVVLSQLGDYRSAIAAVESLQADGLDLPGYVLAAAGDAWAGENDPARALDYFDRALAVAPDDEGAHAGRLFALADLDRLDAAEAMLHARLASESDPARITRERLRLALVRAWGGWLDASATTLAELAAAEPDDTEIAVQQGGIELQRDRPRAALTDFERALAGEPAHRRAAVGRAQALDRLGRWAAADAAFALLAETDRDWRPLARALEERERERGTQLDGSVRAARGADRETAASEVRQEWTLYSPMSDRGLRGYAGWRRAYADFRGQPLEDERLAAGLLWRGHGWRVAVEANTPQDRYSDDNGLAVDIAWRIDDAWEVAAGWADTAFDVPLRGRAVGTTGDRGSVAVRWTPTGQAWLRAALSETGYSDGNRNRTVSLAAAQRWALTPTTQFTLTPAVYAGRNRSSDVPYFSPERDLSLELGGRWEQRLHARAGRRFGHWLEGMAGQYRQRGVDAEPIATVLYGQYLEPAPGRRIYWRLARSRRAYDGTPEYQTSAEAGLHWSF